MDCCEAFMVAESMQLATVTSKGNEQIRFDEDTLDGTLETF